MVKANFTFTYYIYLYVMCGLRYIIKLFWEKTDLAMCNCRAATLNISLKHWYVYMADVWGSWSTTHYRCLPRAIIPLACLQMFHSALL